ncbi:hypothetical protein H072_4236 [Dactylellina haptotyla CBS 200.50]|uniref:WSC domain-containing protein n=1 Tax=Dactylellina haptotyla (strain CBS 200.50) TaxID=1284197 RepID=S8BQZ3_DACHA|nr:hypothetical protein H072_4236 [Dactylellina haptotyla CBS 200.50]
MHFSTLFTTATVILAGFADISSARLVIIDAWGSNKPSIHGYGLGYDQKNDRKGLGFSRVQDVAVFNRYVRHDGSKSTNYLPNGCGFSGMSVGNWYRKNRNALWKEKGDKLFFKMAPAEARIPVSKQVENLSLQAGQNRVRVCPATKRKLKTGIPRIAPGKTFVVITEEFSGKNRLINCRIDYKGTASSWTRQLKNVGCIQGGRRETKGACTRDKLRRITGYRFAIPKDLNCRGVYGPFSGIRDICMIRCQDAAENGPFGACIPAKQVRPVKVRVVTVTETLRGRTSKATKTVTETVSRVVPKVTTNKVTTTVTDVITKPPAPAKTETVTVEEDRTVYVVVVGGKRVTKTATQGEVIKITRPARPVTETITTTMTQIDEYEDEVSASSDDNGDEAEIEDEPEDESNVIPDVGDSDEGEDDDDKDGPFTLSEDPDAAEKLRFRRE